LHAHRLVLLHLLVMVMLLHLVLVRLLRLLRSVCTDLPGGEPTGHCLLLLPLHRLLLPLHRLLRLWLVAHCSLHHPDSALQLRNLVL
jgi:hypothetical protein